MVVGCTAGQWLAVAGGGWRWLAVAGAGGRTDRPSRGLMPIHVPPAVSSRPATSLAKADSVGLLSLNPHRDTARISHSSQSAVNPDPFGLL